LIEKMQRRREIRRLVGHPLAFAQEKLWVGIKFRLVLLNHPQFSDRSSGLTMNMLCV